MSSELTQTFSYVMSKCNNLMCNIQTLKKKRMIISPTNQRLMLLKITKQICSVFSTFLITENSAIA